MGTRGGDRLSMAKVGRPRKLKKKDIKEITEKFWAYIKATEVPIVSEFAYTHEVSRDDLYNYPEFSTVLKACTTKKESQLERLGLMGEVNTPMAIFSLKQLGWSDKQETKHSGGVDVKLELIDASEDEE